MKTFRLFIAVILFLGIFPAINAYSDAGHCVVASSQQQFRIDVTEVHLGLNPSVYVKGSVPAVEIALTDSMSGEPVLDAELYIRLDKKGQSVLHGGHTMSPDAGSNSSTGEGLDFGDTSGMANAVDLSTFKRLGQGQKAGIYFVPYPLPDKGEYTFSLAVKALSGKKYADPIIFGGDLSYQPQSRAPLYRMLFVIASILASGLIGIWIMVQRKKLRVSSGTTINLLDIPWLKNFMVSIWFQPFLQIAAFIVFLVIITAGLGDIQAGDKNIATLLTWTIWWAAIIFTFVFVGRIWCAVCPVGAIQDWVGKIGSLNKTIPRHLRNIWLSSFLFLGLTWLDSYSKIVNRPALTAYLVIGLFAVASVMAVIYKGRTFCRYVCPIGGLIGLYSMFSPVELRNRCLETCKSHKVKECVKGTSHSNPCPMFQTPMTLDRNNYCNFCSECIKSCSKDNIVIRFRNFAKDLWVSSRGYLDEAFLAIALVGITIIVTGEMIEPWHGWMDSVGKLIPFDALGIVSHVDRERLTFSLVLAAGALVIAPLTLLLTSAMVRALSGKGTPGIMETFIHFAYMFIPVGISMHLAHNISHLFKEGPGIVPAVQRAANEYLSLDLGMPDWQITALMGAEAIYWLQMVILITLNIFSLYAGYRIAEKHYGDKALRAFIPMALLAVTFSILNAYILGQPMALRHTH